MIKQTLLFIALLFLLPGVAQEAADTPPAEAPPEERVTEITSDHLLFDYGNKLAVFTGNVVVTDPDMNITADELTIHLDDEDQVRLIVAKGNVVIRMEGMHSVSGLATYTPADQKLVLEERPQVFRENSVLTGTVITYFRLEDRMQAENPRLINFEDAQRERTLNF